MQQDFIINRQSSIFNRPSSVFRPLHLSRTLYKSPTFYAKQSQFPKSQMNAKLYNTTDYENKWQRKVQKNKPNSNPISNAVKIFLNLPEIWNQIVRITSQLAKPTAFYLGKLQDGLALDPLTGYSRTMVPFFARQKQARLILLTKSNNVENLLDLDHQQHTVLSWSLNPSEVSSTFERNVPSPSERVAAMQKCADAGYPIRAVIMPVIPIEGWQNIYVNFLESLLMPVPLAHVRQFVDNF